jgi:flagellar biosynthetic protein FliP
VTAPAAARTRPAGARPVPPGRRTLVVLLFALVLAGLGTALAAPAMAAPAAPAAPAVPTKAATTPAGPSGPAGPAAPTGAGVNISVGNGSPSSSITLILAVTVLAVAPSVLLLCTSFTKIVVVLGLTRNALGLQTSPPNQVITGIALFLTLFVMGPVLSQINKDALQPYLDGHMTVSQAYDTGVVPLKKFMLHNTRSEELKLMVDLSGEKKPADQSQVSMTTLIPAFVLSELKSAFIIGLVIFIPFLVLDMLVSAGLMSMGMMMVPPAIVSLPFKLLLFVVVDGWALITTALVGSYT